MIDGGCCSLKRSQIQLYPLKLHAYFTVLDGDHRVLRMGQNARRFSCHKLSKWHPDATGIDKERASVLTQHLQVRVTTRHHRTQSLAE